MSEAPGAGAEGVAGSESNIEKVKRLLKAALSKIPKVGSNSRGAFQPTPPGKLTEPVPLNPINPLLSTLLGEKFEEYIEKKML